MRVEQSTFLPVFPFFALKSMADFICFFFQFESSSYPLDHLIQPW